MIDTSMTSAFSDDYELISLVTSRKFGLFTTEPFAKIFECGDFGAKKCEILNSSSLLFLVGSGDDSSFSPRKLRVVNSKRLKVICELSFPTTIVALKAGGKKLIVALEDQILIYDISSMKLMYTIVAAVGDGSIFACSSECTLIAYASDEPGQLNIFDTEKLNIHTRVKAHKSSIRCARFSPRGKYLATASEKDGSLMEEYRRGSKPTTVSSLNFSSDERYLTVTSDSDTVHIYKVAEEANNNISAESHGMMGFLAGKRDFAILRVHSGGQIVSAIVKAAEGQVLVLMSSGVLDVYAFDPKIGGECSKLRSFRYSFY